MSRLTGMPGGARPGRAVVCVDVGSTFTKAAAIGPDGTVLATAQHPTTSGTDVLVGLDAAVAGLGVGGVPDSSVVVCSSAGGGLRLAVVGQERVISAEAGRRVALSAGARVVAVSAGLLDDAGIEGLAAARPDVLLVVGGTDGGDTEVLLHNARVLGRSRLRVPTVIAGNADAAGHAAALVSARRRVVLPTANVIPRIGVLHPGPARRAIREVFIAHVIGGKGLSQGRRFAGLVVCATPDAVLAGIEVVAEVLAGRPGAAGDVMALDIGGATTDVYSVITPDDQVPDEAVETLWHGRSVEGDLGMRWSAQDVVAAALVERLLEPAGAGGAGPAEALAVAAEIRRSDVGFLPVTAAQRADELGLARLAAVIAARRHARPGAEGSRDLTHVGLLIGSGGVLRHADPAAAVGVLDAVLTDYAGGWRLPARARVLVDRQYLLAPIGLLEMSGRPDAARALAEELVSTPTSPR
jgi:uncharacterized protein (TIGR01319 family)